MEASKNRLLIHKLKIENFKSYATAREIGPFHANFSAVVGPNGSGKSNVIDALLFVFGKRAKKLRLNKIAELVHKSTSFPNETLAKVSVYFHEIDEVSHEIVPNTEFVVTRTASVDNVSKYYINDTCMSYTKVMEFLKKCGIDLEHNRFLILQGEVEQIAMMAPKKKNESDEGLLEYLEDIIGTNVYIEKIQMQDEKLESCNAMRVEKVSLFRIMEKERETYQALAHEAVDYIMAQYELFRKRESYYALKLEGAEEEKKSIELKVEALKEEQKKCDDLMKDKRLMLKEMDKSYMSISKEQMELLKKVGECKESYGLFEKKDIQLQEQLKQLEEELNLEKNKIIKEEKKGSKREKQKMQLEEKDIPCWEEAKIELNEHIQRIEIELEKAKEQVQGETSALYLELEAKQELQRPIVTKLREYENKINAKSTEKKLIQDMYTKRSNEKINMQKDFDQGILAEKQNIQTLAQYKTLLENCPKEKQHAQASLKTLDQKEKSIQHEKNQIENQLLEAKSVQEQFSNQNALEKSFHTAVRKGGPLEHVEFYGRLGSLGSIDGKYDIAISTACPSLQNFVVQKTTDAQACVKFLREKSLGRATFIILDELSYLSSRMNTPFDAKRKSLGNPRLFDVIKSSKPIFLPAFYFAMRDTIVAPTIDIASKVAFGDGKGKSKYRVVTEDGQMIEMSGAMSGGGKQVRKGGMGGKPPAADGLQLSTIEKAQLESKMANLSKELSGLLGERKTLKQNLQHLLSQEDELGGKVPILELEIKSWNERKESLSSRLASIHIEVSDEDRTQMDNIEGEIMQIKQGQDAVLEENQKISKLIESIQSKIDGLEGNVVQGKQSELDALTTKLNKLIQSITKGKSDVKSHEKAITTCASNVAKWTDGISIIEQSLIDTRLEFKKVEEDAFTVHAALATAKESLDSITKRLQEQKVECDQVKSAIEAGELSQVDSKHHLEECLRSMHNQKARFEKLETKLVQVKQDSSDLQTTYSTSIERRLANTSDEDCPVQKKLLQDDVTEFDLSILEKQCVELKGKVQLGSIQVYEEKNTEYEKRLKALEEITSERDAIRKQYDALCKTRLDEFLSGFQCITGKLKEMYQMITLGGDAELELVDSLDPFAEGIVFSVRPAKKSWKNISNLSGGEKTLASLALVFALHHYKPTPLYVMDEIDAALDFKNVSIVGNYIKERTKNAQFIIISLRNNMFELADSLVGIYKTNDTTKSVTIDPKQFGSIKSARTLSDRTNL